MNEALDLQRERAPRVLLVEDNERDQALLAEILTRSGYECDQAGTCEEGRQKAEAEDYACALVDLGLPDGSGLSLLSDFSAICPFMVPIVLTGDGSANSIIETMRAGAFDYLTKPVTMARLRAAVSRAVSHHDAVRDRAELVKLLLDEREQLRARIDAATADIRQYATQCEISSARFRTLLRLSQLSAQHSPDEAFMNNVLTELGKHIPLRVIAVCDVTRQKFLAIGHPDEDDPPMFFMGSGAPGGDAVLAEVQPQAVAGLWLEEQTAFAVDPLTAKVFTKTFWGRSRSIVAFYLAPDYELDPSDDEFLDMCGHFLAFEWEQSKLLLNVAHHASLGRVAVELARNFIQPLTAIHTALDFIGEIVPPTPEFKEGMEVISQNLERLRLQTQELRRLGLLREESIETVYLDEYIDRALDILAVAIQNRGVTIEKDFQSGCECVLMNGTMLARTFLDIILMALRSAGVGSAIRIELARTAGDHVQVELRYAVPIPKGDGRQGVSIDDSTQRQPELELVQRTIQSCGGHLSVERTPAETVIHIVLPRNINDTAAVHLV